MQNKLQFDITNIIQEGSEGYVLPDHGRNVSLDPAIWSVR